MVLAFCDKKSLIYTDFMSRATRVIVTNIMETLGKFLEIFMNIMNETAAGERFLN
jgi:hypothetical protein